MTSALILSVLAAVAGKGSSGGSGVSDLLGQSQESPVGRHFFSCFSSGRPCISLMFP